MGMCHLPVFRAWRRCRSLTAVLAIFFLWLCFISVINLDTGALEPVIRDTAASSKLGFKKRDSSSSPSSSFSSFRTFIETPPLQNLVDYSHSFALDAVVSLRRKEKALRQGPLTALANGKLGPEPRALVDGLIRGRRIQEIRSTKTGVGSDILLPEVKVSVDMTGTPPSVTEDERIDKPKFFPTPAIQDVWSMQQSMGRNSEAFSRVGQGSSLVSHLDIPIDEERTNQGQLESSSQVNARNLNSPATRYNLRARSTVEKLHPDARAMGGLLEGKSIDYEWPRAVGKAGSRWTDLYDSEDVVKVINKRFKNDQLDRQEPLSTVSERLRSDLTQNTFQNRAVSSVNLDNVMSAHVIKDGSLLEWESRKKSSMQMEVGENPRNEELPFLPYNLIDQSRNPNEGLAMKLNGMVFLRPPPPAQRAVGVNEGNGDSLNVLQSYKTLARPHEKRGYNGSLPYQDSPARGGGEVTNWGLKNDEKATIDGNFGIRSQEGTTQLGVIKEEKDKKEKGNEHEIGKLRGDKRRLDKMRQVNRSPAADATSSATLNTTSMVWKVQEGRWLKSDGFQLYAYNVTASDAIGMRRQLPDTRPPGCDILPAYSKTELLPKATVVICFHNEALSVLLRTVQSVLDRTPSYLLDKVVLVDDNSTFDILGKELSRHLQPFGPVVVLKRTKGRQGLTRARLLGASEVKSSVIVFLDAHVECNTGWLEPLLFALLEKPNMVVSPYIDTIKSESFQYKRSPPGLQGGFNWRLEFGWRAASIHSTDHDTIEAIRTPVISGGLFAVRTKYFNALEGYDPLLEIWGGENFELSFKTWMCGGSMEIHPCSRVGHVFRASLPYRFKDGRETTVLRNLARVSRVWMDEYTDTFEAAVNLPSNFHIGDISQRIEIRQKLGCKSFRWYLNNVYPQMEIVPANAIFYGQVRNKGSLMCIEVKNNNSKYYLGLSACKGGENQTLYLTSQGLLKYGEACIIPSSNKLLTISSCVHNFTWIYQDKQLHAASAKDFCLVSVDNELVHFLSCLKTSSDKNIKSSDHTSSPKPNHSSAVIYNEKIPSDLSEANIFQHWTFDYSFNWKRRKR